MTLRKSNAAILIVVISMLLTISSWYCTSAPAVPDASSEIKPKTMTADEMLERGRYLVHAGGCNDCHSPKMMTPEGPMPDTSRLLSGHPANSPAMAVVGTPTTPGSWMLFSPDITTYIGPWGQSFSANLTPDSATGLGAWQVSDFINTIRKGKHLGQDGGRPLMPPMPWQEIRNLTDEDLQSIFTYLQTLPAISNRVPMPVPPTEIGKK